MQRNIKVIERRKLLRYTQAQIAELADMRQAEISQIESEGWIPPADKRQRLATALDTTPEQIFDLTERVAS